MADLWNTNSARGVGAGHVDDRGYGVGAAATITAQTRCRAVRQVAMLSRDAGECARVLDQLGLAPAEGVSS